MYYGIKLASGYINSHYIFSSYAAAKRFSEDIAKLHGGGVAVWEPFPFSELTFSQIATIYHSRHNVFYVRAASMCKRVAA